MLCNKVTSGIDGRFFYLCTRPASTSNMSMPDPSACLILRTHFPKTALRVRTGVDRVKTRAAVNDGLLVEASMSFYDLLGIPESGTLPEIKQAYKQLARKYHPDVSPPGRVDEYTRRFIRVQEAYETLSDPGRRAVYDRDMARGLHLAFSARRRGSGDQGMEERSEWKTRWQSQLSELKRRSTCKDGGGNMSWGARMRRQRNESSSQL